MARIETYPLDSVISPNDFLLGSDGDNLNATKNYKVTTFLDYLGTQYNLQSVDLVYDFNAVASGSVGDGDIVTVGTVTCDSLIETSTRKAKKNISDFSKIIDVRWREFEMKKGNGRKNMVPLLKNYWKRTPNLYMGMKNQDMV